VQYPDFFAVEATTPNSGWASVATKTIARADVPMVGVLLLGPHDEPETLQKMLHARIFWHQTLGWCVACTVV